VMVSFWKVMLSLIWSTRFSTVLVRSARVLEEALATQKELVREVVWRFERREIIEGPMMAVVTNAIVKARMGAGTRHLNRRLVTFVLRVVGGCCLDFFAIDSNLLFV